LKHRPCRRGLRFHRHRAHNIFVIEPVAQLRQVLPREGEDARAVFGRERELPALGGFHCVTRAKHQQIRNGTQGRKMLNRLMRRSVFPKAD